MVTANAEVVYKGHMRAHAAAERWRGAQPFFLGGGGRMPPGGSTMPVPPLHHPVIWQCPGGALVGAAAKPASSSPPIARMASRSVQLPLSSEQREEH